MKKFVFSDTNSRHCDADTDMYCIHETEIQRGNLTEGDLVTAYMDHEEWDAQIVRHGQKWGLVLLSEARKISKKRYEGHAEGFSHGMLVQKLRALRVLDMLDLPDDLKEEAKRRMMLI